MAINKEEKSSQHETIGPQEVEMTPLGRPQEELPRCYPHVCGRPLYRGNQEALAWALDTSGRGVVWIGSGAFLATALLKLAKEAAGCETEAPPGEPIPECDNRVHGIRPSSLLTTYTIVIGLLSATLMPFMGAIIDYTNYRLKLGRFLTVTYCCLLFPQIFISSETWFAIAIIQIAVAFIGWGQTMLTYAYLPELTDDAELLNKYSSNFTVVQFGSMVTYLAAVVGVSFAAGLADDSVATARIGQSVSFVVASVTLSYAWSLFRPRPSTRDLPAGQSLWTSGFKQVWHTSVKIYKHYKALKWFYVSVAFADAAMYSLATIAVTYLTNQLQFTSLENGIAILVMLIASVPGGVLAGWCTARFHNPIWTSIASVTIMAVNTLVVGIVLQKPGQQIATYILAAGWGLGTGWKWTADRLLSSTIIPTGQDAELMGMYLFAGQVITWVPPLVFTGLNEAGVSQRIGIISLDVFFVISGIAYLLMGSYKEAIEVASRHKPPADTRPIEENPDDLAAAIESSIEPLQN